MLFIISREWDGDTLLPGFLDSEQLILICHMVPFVSTAASVGSKVRAARLSVAVSSLEYVSLPELSRPQTSRSPSPRKCHARRGYRALWRPSAVLSICTRRLTPFCTFSCHRCRTWLRTKEPRRCASDDLPSGTTLVSVLISAAEAVARMSDVDQAQARFGAGLPDPRAGVTDMDPSERLSAHDLAYWAVCEARCRQHLSRL
jgi:hypothetical protein